MSRLVAEESLARLLRIIPYVSEQPDGMKVSDIVERFDYPRAQLLKDFQEVVPFVGVHPFTPDVEIWAEISDDRVYVERPHWFSQPLRLAKEEAARVLALCKAALELGDDTDAELSGLLFRACLKLSDELGSAGESSVEVELESVNKEVLDLLRNAVEQHRRIELDYFSSSGGAQTRCLVDPHRVFSDSGFWYVAGWCHLSEVLRPFRLDRILDARLTDDVFEPDPAAPDVDPSAFASGADKPRAVLRVDPTARWMLEVGFPVEEIAETDGALEVTLIVASVPWLAQLLLRLGPQAEIVHLDPGLPADIRHAAAARVLERYR